MKPGSSFIIPSSSALVLPFGGPGDMAVQQLHGAHNFCETEEVNPTEPVRFKRWQLWGGWCPPPVRGENKNCMNPGYFYTGILVLGAPDQE